MKSSTKLDGDYAVIRLPMEDVHSLRVALAECPCRGPKSEATKGIRERLSGALGKLETEAQRQGWRPK